MRTRRMLGWRLEKERESSRTGRWRGGGSSGGWSGMLEKQSISFGQFYGMLCDLKDRGSDHV